MRRVLGASALRRMCGRHVKEAAGETIIVGSVIIRAVHEGDRLEEGGVGRTTVPL
jgi:hypothetical protein